MQHTLKSGKNLKLTYRLTYSIFLLFVIMHMLMGFSYNNADYYTYQAYYNNYTETGDMGYDLLVEIGRYFSIDYQTFLIIISFVSLILLFQGVFKLSNNPTQTLVLYTVFPFFFDIVQIRNFIALSVTIYAFTFLLEKSVSGYFKYTLLVIIAALFHNVALFYLVYLLSHIDSLSKLRNLIITLTTFFTINLNSNFNIFEIPLIRNILLGINPRIYYYLRGNALEGSTAVLYILYILFFFIISIFTYKFVMGEKFNSKVSIGSIQLKKLQFLTKISTISLLFIPFVTLDPTLFRVFRNMLVVYYMQLSYLTIRIKKNNIIINIIASFFLNIVVILSFVNFLLLDSSNYETVTKPTLIDNLILSDSSSLIILLILLSSPIFITVYLILKMKGNYKS